MDYSVWLLLLFLARASIGSPTMYGEITFHHGPQGYPNNAQKSWLISVPKGFGIKLTFFHLDVEPSEGCDQDSVQLIIGDEVKEKICGFRFFWSSDVQLQAKHFSTNLLRVNFTSNESNMEKYTGFSLNFVAIDIDECKESSKSNCSHFCNNYIGGYFCSCQPGYFLLPDKHTCGDVDCGPPNRIENGYANFSQTTYSSEATYSCISEYYNLTSPASGDGTYLCSSNGLWVSTDGGHELPKCVPVCGMYDLADSPRGRIFGGSKATLGQFPWQIAFYAPNRGAGALISDRWILTAASVVEENDNPEMYGGLINLHTRTDKQLLKANKVIIHPKWVTQPLDERVNYDNDIALIYLCSSVQLGPYISPVCLPEGTSPEFNDNGYVAGWGQAEKRDRSGDLLYIKIPLQKMEKCKELDKDKTYTFTSNMLCAGDGAGHDSCGGDSGSPLTFHDHNNNDRMYVAGIVSWGVGCGKYGVYTKVENFLDWIKETMEKEESEEGGGADAECV